MNHTHIRLKTEVATSELPKTNSLARKQKKQERVRMLQSFEPLVISIHIYVYVCVCVYISCSLEFLTELCSSSVYQIQHPRGSQQQRERESVCENINFLKKIIHNLVKKRCQLEFTTTCCMGMKKGKVWHIYSHVDFPLVDKSIQQTVVKISSICSYHRLNNHSLLNK